METLSDPRFVGMEDMKNKYSRVVAGSLKTLAFYADSVSANSIAETMYKTILSTDKFWEHLYASDPLIRRSFYSFIKVLALKHEGMNSLQFLS
jgi:hypothetical protein